jgi:nicotinamidase-related amidase
MADLQLDRARTALLCMDMHGFTMAHLPEETKQRLLAATGAALDVARKANVTVIYVAAARRPDFTSPRNKFTSSARAAAASTTDQADRTRIVDPVAPREGEPIVRKPRMSAFFGSELQSMLAARDIDTLVLSGVSTNFVVESTARYAVDADYRVIVLEDCCAAGSQETHARALASMEPMVHIATSKDFLAALA